MGYAGYFLIVADFMRFAREQGIATTCRGSAPGSIVTYTLGITPVDPIHYELPFERFLNPDRVTMPDIDVDFEDSRRDEVIAYVTRKYGSDHVAQIITFGTMLARAAIRDVGRVLGFGYGEVDRIAKAVPNQLGIKLDEALETSRRPPRAWSTRDPQVDRLIDLARQVEGVARNASTHAAGVVISREPLTELMPLQRATNSDALMTQYEMHGVEALGLLKFDFLGLSQPDHPAPGGGPHRRSSAATRIDLEHIPLDDARTFELLASGETTGVFQLESPGMRRYVKELRPTSVLRPGGHGGPLPARAHGQHPRLHPPQARPGAGDLPPPAPRAVPGEDVRHLRVPGGHHVRGQGAGRLHRARGGHPRLRHPQEEVGGPAGAEGEVRHAAPPSGASRRTSSTRVFKAFEPFERYGFNKAHATCYGLIAYQTAYLKANYTVEYMTSVLTALRDNAEKVAAAIAECRRLGIEVRPPDVQRSGLDFTRRGRGHPLRPAGRQERRPGRHRVDHRGSRGGRGRSARWPTSARGSTCAWSTGGSWSRWSRSGALDRLGHPAQLLDGLDDALADRAGRAARPAHRPDVALRPRRRAGGARDAPARCAPRRPSASACAGRRSCWACTSRITRSVSSPSRSAAT